MVWYSISKIQSSYGKESFYLYRRFFDTCAHRHGIMLQQSALCNFCDCLCRVSLELSKVQYENQKVLVGVLEDKHQACKYDELKYEI